MKLKPLLFAFAIGGAIQSNAQTWVNDSVSTKPGYIEDVYYSMKNRIADTGSNTNWHMAFQMTPQSGPSASASILANHVMGKVTVYSLHMQASTHFTTLAAADTVGKTSSAQQLLNSATTWNDGAFNKNRDISNPFDFGWGKYDQTTHNLSGDSLYLVKVNNVPYKVWFKEYVSTPLSAIEWTFRIAKFDGTEDTTVVVPRQAGGYDFSHNLFGYYDITNKTILNREPYANSWDILFTRYIDTASQGPIFMNSPVAGVFSNSNVSVAEVHNVNPDSAYYQNYTYSSDLNAIGYDWKHFNQTTMQYNVDSTVFFVKSGNTNEYYQLQFTGFGSSATGKYYFRKRLVGTVNTAVNNVTANTVTAFALVPNPAQNEASIMVDAQETAQAQLVITDITGKLVQRSTVSIQKGMNGYRINTGAMPNGTYLVTITNGSWKIAEKLSVQH